MASSSSARKIISSLPVLPSLKKRHRSFCHSTTNHPLLTKLLQSPTSQIKATLDSNDTFTLTTPQFPWNTIISTLSSSSPAKAHQVLEWRLERLIKDNNDTNHADYSNLISLCSKIHDVSLGIRVFHSMEANGIKPTTSIFNSLIRVCLSSNDVMTAISLFEIMESSDCETYDVFVSGFSSLRNLDKMKAWFAAKIADGFNPSVENYEAVISGCVKIRDFAGADRFYEEMESVGVLPSLFVLENVVEGFCRRRDCDRVKEVLRFAAECGFEITKVMIENVESLCRELRRVEEMEELLQMLVVEFDQCGSEALSELYSGIIRLYAMLDRLDDVEYSVGRMMNQGMAFRSSDDVEKVISLYFRQEAYDRLDVFLEHIKSSYKITRSTYDLLVSGYRRAGLVERIDLVIKDMNLAGL